MKNAFVKTTKNLNIILSIIALSLCNYLKYLRWKLKMYKSLKNRGANYIAHEIYEQFVPLQSQVTG